jgi:hypothetical protein
MDSVDCLAGSDKYGAEQLLAEANREVYEECKHIRCRKACRHQREGNGDAYACGGATVFEFVEKLWGDTPDFCDMCGGDGTDPGIGLELECRECWRRTMVLLCPDCAMSISTALRMMAATRLDR